MDTLINTLNSFTCNTNFSKVAFCLNKNIAMTFNECLVGAFQECAETNILLFKIDSVIDYIHDELNTGHWSEVPIKIRRVFTAANFIKV